MKRFFFIAALFISIASQLDVKAQRGGHYPPRVVIAPVLPSIYIERNATCQKCYKSNRCGVRERWSNRRNHTNRNRQCENRGCDKGHDDRRYSYNDDAQKDHDHEYDYDRR